MTQLQQYLPDYVMESLFDMRLAQEPKDRLHYIDTVLESATQNSASILQKLYTDIISKSNIDFGKIPDSRGALTKYSDYPTMAKAMEYLNKLFEGTTNQNITIMNRLHDVIVSCRKDYEYGYTYDIDIIKITYCTAVVTLYDMINICILEYTKKMRTDAKIALPINKTQNNDTLVVRGAKSLIKNYESNNWTKLMNALKKNPTLFTAATSTSTANEAGIFGDKSIGEVIHDVPLPLAIIAAVIALFVALRGLIYGFFFASNKVKESSKNCKEFVDFAIKQEKNDGTSDSVIKKHQSISDKLEGLANFIEVKIFKSDNDAKKALAKSDKENFSTAEIKQTSNNPFGGAIEF